MMEFNIKEYKQGDEEQIFDVFNKSFHRQMSYNYWKWRYLDNPYLNSNYINLAWDGDRLAAHYAVSPVQIYVQGQKYNAALSMTTMTDPEYQGMGLFTKLAKDLYGKKSNILDIVFGVPNENSVNGFTKKLDFELIKEIPMLTAKMEEKNYDISDHCKQIDAFDERYDELFQMMTHKYNIITARDSNYLNWRFVHNPQNEYKIITYIDENKVLGYVVAKIYKDSSGLTGDIVDMLAMNPQVLKDLLSSAFSYFQSEKVLMANIWFNDVNYMDILQNFGFQKSEKQFHFIVRNNSDSKKEGIFNFDNWYLTMSDIDLF